MPLAHRNFRFVKHVPHEECIVLKGVSVELWLKVKVKSSIRIMGHDKSRKKIKQRGRKKRANAFNEQIDGNANRKWWNAEPSVVEWMTVNNWKYYVPLNGLLIGYSCDFSPWLSSSLHLTLEIISFSGFSSLLCVFIVKGEGGGLICATSQRVFIRNAGLFVNQCVLCVQQNKRHAVQIQRNGRFFFLIFDFYCHKQQKQPTKSK